MGAENGRIIMMDEGLQGMRKGSGGHDGEGKSIGISEAE